MSNRVSCRIVGSFKDYAQFWVKQRHYDRLISIVNTHYLNQITSSQNGDHHLLDIGCGAAWNIDKLHEDFKKISLIEPNLHFQDIWSKHKWMNDDVMIYQDTMENIIDYKDSNILPLEANSIDVIISHHSIYHYSLERLDEIILHKMSLLKQTESSLMIITMLGDDQDFIKHCFKKINPNYKLSETLESILTVNNINYEIDDSYIATGQKGKPNMIEFLKWFIIQYCCNVNWMQSFDYNDNKMMQFIEKTINSFIDNYCREYSVCGGHVYDFDALSKHYIISL